MNTSEIKFELQQQCTELISARLDSIQKTIKDLEASLKDETKCTSGDKHHTGRAMLQIDRENAGRQLSEVEKVMRQLDMVDIENSSEVIRLGSIAETNQAAFFMSISVGKLEINDTVYLGIAPNSPIGLNLLGKKKGEQFNFNGTVYKILRVD